MIEPSVTAPWLSWIIPILLSLLFLLYRFSLLLIITTMSKMFQVLIKHQCYSCILFFMPSDDHTVINDIVFLHIIICPILFIFGITFLCVSCLFFGFFTQLFLPVSFTCLLTFFSLILGCGVTESQVSHACAYYMSIPSLTGLWLVCPELILISPFLGS